MDDYCCIFEIGKPYHLSSKALKHWNIIFDSEITNPVIPGNAEQVEIIINLDRRFPEDPPKSGWIKGDGSPFKFSMIQTVQTTEKMIYPIFLGQPGTKSDLVELKMMPSSSGRIVKGLHLIEKTFSVPIYIMENVTFLIPSGTKGRIVQQNEDLSFAPVQEDNLKVVCWILPAGIKVLSSCGSYVEINSVARRIRLSKSMNRFEIGIGTNIVLRNNKVVTGEVIKDVAIDVLYEI